MAVDIQCCYDELISSLQVNNQTDLLDHNNYVDNSEFENIDREKASFISSILSSYQGATPYVYKGALLEKDVYIRGVVQYSSSKDFIIQTKGNIIFETSGLIIN